MCHTVRNNKETLAEKAEEFLNMGYIVVAMDQGSNDDVHQTISWFRGNARKYGGDSGKISLWGYSSGGQRAIRCALTGSGRSEVQGAIIVAGASTKDERMVSRSSPPMLFIHSRDDRTVKFEGSLVVADALEDKGVPVERLWYRTGGHKPHKVNEQEYLDTMKGFLIKRFGRVLALADAASVDENTAGNREMPTIDDDDDDHDNDEQDILGDEYYDDDLDILDDENSEDEYWNDEYIDGSHPERRTQKPNASLVMLSAGQEELDREGETFELSTGIVDKNLRYSGRKRADVYYQRGWSSRPAIIMCHTVRNNKETLAEKAEEFLNMGYIVVAMDQGSNDDVHQTISWFRGNARKYGGDSGKISLWGYSSGGQRAIRCALTGSGRSEVQGAIIVAGASTKDERMVSRSSPPMLFIHSRDDRTVKFEGSLVVADALEDKGVPVERLWYRTGGHKPHKVNEQEYLDTMKGFLVKRFGRVLALADTASASENTTQSMASLDVGGI